MARWNEQDSMGSGTFLLGALAGALVGAGVALLMAPKSGAQTRHDLSEGYSSVRDAAARRYRDLADKANTKIEQASAKLGYEDKTTDRYNGGTSASMGDSYTATPGTSGYQS
jgi:gas vesicle protein